MLYFGLFSSAYIKKPQKVSDIHNIVTRETNGFGIYFQGGNKYGRGRSNKQYRSIWGTE